MPGTIIQRGLTVEGELTSEEEVVMLGTFRGRLAGTDAVSIGPSGVVEADVSASSLSVAGELTGDVQTKLRVDLQAGGKLVGDVKTGRLTIADGATFKGNVDMDV